MNQLFDIVEPGTPAPKPEVAVGIDLGTTYSLVAVSREGKVEVLPDAEGKVLLPSVVTYGNHTIRSIKRLMGRGAEDKDAAPELAPLVDVRASGEGLVRLRIGDRLLTPVEISSEILKKLKARAEKALGETVTKAVITVPAYFDDAARTATKDAARLAGLEVLRLVNEPTAAALAYGLDRGAEGIYAIYDFGGGTFDFSLLRMEKGVFQVLATGGHTLLGGNDIDHVIMNHLSLADSVLARQAKEALSSQEVWEHKGLKLDRGTLEQLAEPLVRQTLNLCRQVLSDAGVALSDIKGVVLVGGSTRMPLVRIMVWDFFEKQPITDIDPDQVVAVGAAIQAGALTHGADMLLLDVTPLSLGLETYGGLVERIIPRNTPIPTAAIREFTTYQDGQSGMQLQVVQGEREMANQCRSLARFELTGIPPLPAGQARVKVMFTLDADGLLTVSAEEKTTGARQEVIVKPTYGVGEGENERMLQENREHAREDIAKRLLKETSLEAASAIRLLEDAMGENSALLKPEEENHIRDQVNILRELLRGSNRDRMLEELDALNQVSASFMERLANDALQKKLSGVPLREIQKQVQSAGNK